MPDPSHLRSGYVQPFPAEICGIPAYLVNNHNESFYHWQRSGLTNSTLFHIDEHSDMGSEAPHEERPGSNYHEKLTITNFICAAVHYGIVSSVYWLEPDMGTNNLRNMGGVYYRKMPLGTKVETLIKDKIVWEELAMGACNKPLIPVSDLVISEHHILDIDLDAFCTPYFGGVVDSHSRACEPCEIMESLEILRSIRKPELITIARSQGGNGVRCFVPPELVDGIQADTIQALTDLYK